MMSQPRALGVDGVPNGAGACACSGTSLFGGAVQAASNRTVASRMRGFMGFLVVRGNWGNFTVFAEGIAVFSPGRKVWEGR